MWRDRKVLLALGATAAMGLLFGMILATVAGGGNGRTSQAGNTATGTVSSPAGTSPGATTEPGTPAPTDLRDLDYGYLSEVRTEDGKKVLAFDRADFFTGDEAKRRWEAEGKEPLDYYISNVNKRLRDRPVSPDVKVLGSQRLIGQPGPQEIDPERLYDYVDGGAAEGMLITLKYNKQTGEVIEIAEVYLP